MILMAKKAHKTGVARAMMAQGVV